MSRYIARPKSAVVTSEWGEPAWTADLVFQTDDEPQRTGLIDQHGNDLYRISDRQPIGFKAGR